MKNKAGLVAKVGLGVALSVFAIGMIIAERAIAQSSVAGNEGIGGQAAQAFYAKTFVTFAITTNGIYSGTNSPGAAAPGSLWVQLFYTNSWSNFVINTAFTNSAGTNVVTTFTTGQVVVSSAITGAVLRVSGGNLTTSNSVWLSPTAGTNNSAIVVTPVQ